MFTFDYEKVSRIVTGMFFAAVACWIIWRMHVYNDSTAPGLLTPLMCGVMALLLILTALLIAFDRDEISEE